jgi:class 3 adenylate cyclase
MGAEDYLPKPFDPVFLKARIEAGLERKRWHDQEQAYLKIIQAEREKSERLLLNILPAPIAERLKQGESIIADSFAEVTVLFADIVGFTSFSAPMSPAEVVTLLNEIFSIFDRLAEQHSLEKIKTMGDAYMVVSGVPTPRPDHAEAIADMALAMQRDIAGFNATHDNSLSMRIGINTGPVVAGVIGTTKFSYDLWGDTVNIASRMESHGIAGKIQVTGATYGRLQDKYLLERRGRIEVKGKGEMLTYFLLEKREELF